jgi:hypothetical protein
MKKQTRMNACYLCALYFADDLWVGVVFRVAALSHELLHVRSDFVHIRGFAYE